VRFLIENESVSQRFVNQWIGLDPVADVAAIHNSRTPVSNCGKPRNVRHRLCAMLALAKHDVAFIVGVIAHSEKARISEHAASLFGWF
jgi:hypothetical protein